MGELGLLLFGCFLGVWVWLFFVWVGFWCRCLLVCYFVVLYCWLFVGVTNSDYFLLLLRGWVGCYFVVWFVYGWFGVVCLLVWLWV